MTNSPYVKQLLADSRLAFMNRQNDTALSLANKAIQLEYNNADAYKCAGNALMSLQRYDEAVKNYSLAVKYNASNGNRYYDLGFAQATNNKLAEAIKSLAKADELGCTPENYMQLYNLLGVICFDIGRYDDALVNLGKAEKLAGPNLDIMQRKAIIYGIKNDIRNGLHTANQIKLIAPSKYIGYKLAFKLLIQSKHFDVAKKELEKAERYTAPTMDFYFDKMTYELELYNVNKDKAHFHNALEIIQTALKSVKPEIKSTVESYINAAEIYLQLENAEKTIECLQAAQAPTAAYNNGFSIIDLDIEMPAELDDYTIEEQREADLQMLEEKYDEYQLEELAENAVINEDGVPEFFTEIEEAEQEEQPVYKLDSDESFKLSENNKDQINRLYIGAYTLKKDFERVIQYARALQLSKTISYVYIGKYTEANALKKMDSPVANEKYEELIKFFRNAMIKDPTDIMAVTFRIQCCIDVGKYDEAEEICNLLSKEVKEPLLEKITQAKSGGN